MRTEILNAAAVTEEKLIQKKNLINLCHVINRDWDE